MPVMQRTRSQPGQKKDGIMQTLILPKQTRRDSKRVITPATNDLMSIAELESLEVTDSGYPFSSDNSIECIDVGLSIEKRPVCFHCAKIIDFFQIRNQTITFPSLELTSKLRALKSHRISYWTKNDVDFVVDLYKNGAAKRQKQFESIDHLL